MTITVELKPEHQKWLEDEVAAGHFASVDEALRVAVEELMRPLDTDDLAWAKPYVDEAIAQIERGEYVTYEEIKQDLAERIKALR